MASYEYRISLRVWHPTRSLDELTAELNLTPARSVRAGTARTTRAGKPLSGVHAENYWVARIADGSHADRCLASALASVLDTLSLRREFLRNLVADGGRVELFVGWFFHDRNSGDVLDHKLLGRFADLCVGLSLDIYP